MEITVIIFCVGTLLNILLLVLFIKRKTTQPRMAATPPPLPTLDTSSQQTNKIPVERLNIDTGVIVSKHDSIAAASVDTGVHAGGIHSVLSGVRKSAGGYFWRLAGSSTLPTIKTSSSRANKYGTIESYDIATGKKIKTYAHYMDTARDGFNPSNVRQRLMGYGRTTGGVGWRLSDADVDCAVEPIIVNGKYRPISKDQPVESYSPLTGETIRQYATLRDVCKDGHNSAFIRDVLRGQFKTYHKLGWRITPKETIDVEEVVVETPVETPVKTVEQPLSIVNVETLVDANLTDERKRLNEAIQPTRKGHWDVRLRDTILHDFSTRSDAVKAWYEAGRTRQLELGEKSKAEVSGRCIIVSDTIHNRTRTYKNAAEACRVTGIPYQKLMAAIRSNTTIGGLYFTRKTKLDEEAGLSDKLNQKIFGCESDTINQ
jgi:hypothetical protein